MAKTSSFLIILCFIVVGNINARNNDTIQTIRYYSYVHKAEAAILQNNFRLATKNYQKAFRHNNHPFPNDLFIASVCMLKSKINIKELRRWNLLYVYQTNKNLKEKCAQSDYYHGTNYSKTLSKDQWNTIINDTMIISDYAKKIRAQLSKLRNKDQEIRHQMAELYGMQKYYLPVPKSKIMLVDSLNLWKVDQIISDEKFNEFEIGKDGWNAIYLVILHNSQWHRSYAISEKLKEGVKKGVLENRKFAYLIDRFCDNLEKTNPKIECVDGYYYGELLYWIYNNYHTYPQFNKNNSIAINKIRTEIYLNTIEDRITELIYQVQKENLFLIQSNTFSDLPPSYIKSIEDDIKTGKLNLIE